MKVLKVQTRNGVTLPLISQIHTEKLKAKLGQHEFTGKTKNTTNLSLLSKKS